jgi:hypothetical protein
MVEYARLITKSSEGPPTIPPSASHDNGDWSANDIYENELYVDSLTGYIYTRKADTIVLVSTTGVDFEVIHDTTLTGDGTLADPLGVSISPSADNAIESKADGLFVPEGVPYIGATQDVDLGEHQLKAGQIELDQTPTGPFGVAQMRWNDTEGTAEIRLKGNSVTLKVGQEQVKRVVNKTSPAITLQAARYQAVIVSGAQGQRLAVKLAKADSDENSAGTIGLVAETIASKQEGFIKTSGEIAGIDTTGSIQGETWADGDILYLSPTTFGALTNIKPIAPNHLVVIGYVEYAHLKDGKIFIKVNNGYELEELHDVTTEYYDNADFGDSFLILDQLQQLWKRLRFGDLIQLIRPKFDEIYQILLVSGTNIKTVFGQSLLESGNLGYLYRNFSQSIGSNATGETQLLQVVIPANTFSATDKIAFFATFSKTGTATNTTHRIKISTSASMPVGSTSQIAQYASANTIQFTKINRELTISGGILKGYPFVPSAVSDTGVSNNALNSVAFDVTQTQYLYISATPTGVTTDITYLEAFELRTI